MSRDSGSLRSGDIQQQQIQADKITNGTGASSYQELNQYKAQCIMLRRLIKQQQKDIVAMELQHQQCIQQVQQLHQQLDLAKWDSERSQKRMLAMQSQTKDSGGGWKLFGAVPVRPVAQNDSQALQDMQLLATDLQHKMQQLEDLQQQLDDSLLENVRLVAEVALQRTAFEQLQRDLYAIQIKHDNQMAVLKQENVHLQTLQSKQVSVVDSKEYVELERRLGAMTFDMQTLRDTVAAQEQELAQRKLKVVGHDKSIQSDAQLPLPVDKADIIVVVQAATDGELTRERQLKQYHEQQMEVMRERVKELEAAILLLSRVDDQHG